jgi:hypothetical protein
MGCLPEVENDFAGAFAILGTFEISNFSSGVPLAELK